MKQLVIILCCIAVNHAGVVVPSAPVAAPLAAVATPVLSKTVAAEEFDLHPQYRYGYDVQDSLSGDSKGHVEERDGDLVRGEYSLIDADGFKRTVTYTADSLNGFNAVVRREPLVVAAPAVVRTAAPIVAAAPVVKAAAPAVLPAPAVVKTGALVAAAAPLVKSPAIAPVAPVAPFVAAPVLKTSQYVSAPFAAPAPVSPYVTSPVVKTAQYVAAPFAAPAPISYLPAGHFALRNL